MEEVRGTTNLMRLVDRLRAEMTETYYDDNDDRMKTRRPTIILNMKDTYGGVFGADLKLEVTLTQLRSVLAQHDRHIEDVRVWMGNPRYEYTVFESKYSKRINISMNYQFDDRRVKGDDGTNRNFIGYKDADGETVLWNYDDDE
tara:strand:- start:5518 stop:5949 length:432 start_codon:yes stop_codon:yes gene_type:complete